ncbi:MAG: Ig-like domain-containing protein [Candidatus Tectimicrobiota bacterium]
MILPGSRRWLSLVAVQIEAADLAPISLAVTPQAEEQTALQITMLVPQGLQRHIQVRAWNSETEEIFHGEGLVDLTQEAVVLALPLGRLLLLVPATPADLSQQRFLFPEATAFGIDPVLGETSLTIGTWHEHVGAFLLRAGTGTASGSLTLGSCTFTVTTSTFPDGMGPQAGARLHFDPCQVDTVDGRLVVVNTATGLNAMSTPASMATGPEPGLNQPPLARDDTGDTVQPAPVSLNVLANDSDPDGQPLTLTQVSVPLHGIATLQSDTTVQYTPQPTFSGQDSFTYTVSDSQGATATATVQVTVTPMPVTMPPVNQAPVAQDDQATTPAATPVFIAVLANDRDPDGNPLAITQATPPVHGMVTLLDRTTIQYMPFAPFHGLDSFTYTVSDSQGATTTATVQVTVTPVNHAPVAQHDVATTAQDTPITLPLLANDSDSDGDPLTVTTVSTPAHGNVRLLANGLAQYIPEPLYQGVDSFTYTISDSQEAQATGIAMVIVTQAVQQQRLYPGQRFYLGAGTKSGPLSVMEVTGDGIPDVLIDNTRQKVVVLKGLTDGSFAAPETFTDIGPVWRVDVTGDGVPDLLFGQILQQQVVVHVGRLGAPFLPPEAWPVAGELADSALLAVADMNGDGWLDLVVSDPTRVRVLLGQPSRTFLPVAGMPLPKAQHHGSVGDMNGDGVPDVVTNGGVIDSLYLPVSRDSGGILLGRGDGTFTTAIVWDGTPGTFKLADINHDGILDVLTAATSSGVPRQAKALFYLGHGDGRLADAQDLDPLREHTPTSLILEDINGDGQIDILTTSFLTASSFVNVRLGLQHGGFGTAQSFAVGRAPAYLAVADVTGDGLPDLLTLGYVTELTVLPGQEGNPLLGPTTVATPGITPKAVAVRDFTGDGVLDLAMTSAQNVFVAPGLGSGLFGPPYLDEQIPVFSPPRIVEADVNHDSLPDRIMYDIHYSNIEVGLGQNNGTFVALPAFAGGGCGMSGNILAVADVNHDGHPDVINDSICHNAYYYDHTLIIHPGRGNGTFGAVLRFTFTQQHPVYADIAVADVNGDGQPDLILSRNGQILLVFHQ